MRDKDRIFFLNLTVILSIFYFYYWTASTASQNFNSGRNIYKKYNMLANAFIDKRLHLIETNKECSDLADEEYWDNSCYKRKIYVYFGVAPALLFYLPYKLITGSDFSDYMAAFLFFFGGFVFNYMFLYLIKKKYYKSLSNLPFLVSSFVIGICNVSPFMLRRLADYQVAIASGYFFNSATLYFFYTSIKEEKINMKKVLLGSLLSGLAFASRPQNCFFYLASAIVMIFYARKLKKLNLQFFSSLCFPFAVCGLLIGFYNYIRFDNPLEFGFFYQQGVPIGKMFDFVNFKVNSYVYLAHPMEVSKVFPYFYANSFNLPESIRTILPKKYFIEKTAGILFSTPFLIINIFSFFICYVMWKISDTNDKRENIAFPLFESMLVGLPSLSLFVFILGMPFASMRYLGDFLAFFLIFTSLFWFHSLFLSRRIKKAYNFLLISGLTLALISSMIWFSFNICGCDYDHKSSGLFSQSPEQFNALENFFNSIINFFR